MSLLMEALRKAEEAKRRAAQEETPGAASELQLETVASEAQPAQESSPVEASSPNQDTPPAEDIFASLKLADMPDSRAEKHIPDFMLDTPAPAAPDLSWLDSDQPYSEPLQAPVAEAPVVEANSAEQRERIIEKIAAESRQPVTPAADSISSKQSARAIFAAKSKRSKPSKNRVIILSSVLGLILLLGLGAWLIPALTTTGSQFNVPASFDQVAYQAVDPAEDAAVVADADADSVAGTADFITPVAQIQEVATVQLAQDVMPVAASEAPVSVTLAPQAEQVAQTSAAELINNISVSDSAQALVVQPDVIQPPVIQPPSSPIQISRSSPMRNPDMQMLSAWSAYQQGDYAAARILYQQSLARDPDNRDALLGVAASALQQGDMTSSRQAYSHLLSMNPRDPLARTGLLETTANNDPLQREIDLKALLTDYPDMAAISYSLGNLYTEQQRWHDAQQSYYNALLAAKTQAAGPVSPDYAFNLAVSLERINQPRAALDFYREARSLSEQHIASFDSYVLEQRLQALERTLP